MNLPSIRPLVGAALIGIGASCAGPGRPTPGHDTSYAGAKPPPRSWTAAVSVQQGGLPAMQVEFWDGQRTRVVSARDTAPGAFGASPWYRVRPHPAFSTTFRVSMEIPGEGRRVIAEYPLRIERGAFYMVAAFPGDRNPEKWIFAARDARSFPLPPALQKTPADSLWIDWSARGRRCWTCPN
ncbi:MAG TPA: hypothetical protein VFJ16_01875 [Longimicrobium sp.]|nr:hypothetical protein [Longimicrobium sp.]